MALSTSRALNLDVARVISFTLIPFVLRAKEVKCYKNEEAGQERLVAAYVSSVESSQRLMT